MMEIVKSFSLEEICLIMESGLGGDEYHRLIEAATEALRQIAARGAQGREEEELLATARDVVGLIDYEEKRAEAKTWSDRVFGGSRRR